MERRASRRRRRPYLGQFLPGSLRAFSHSLVLPRGKLSRDIFIGGTDVAKVSVLLEVMKLALKDTFRKRTLQFKCQSDP